MALPQVPAAVRDAACMLDRDGRIVAWNAAAEQLFGFRCGEALGRPCREVVGCHDLWSHALGAPRCPALQVLHGGPVAPACPLLVRNRLGRTFAVIESVLLLSAGAERRACLRFVPIPSGVVDPNPWAGGPETALGARPDLAAALDRLLAATDADAAEVFLAGPMDGHLVLAAHRGLAPRAFRQMFSFEPGTGFPGLVAQTGEPLLSLDLPHDGRYLRTLVKQRGFRSYLCVPVAGQAGVLGSLHLAWLRRDEALAFQLPLLAGVAHGLGRALELARLRAAEPIAGHLRDPSADAGADFRALADLVLATLLETTAAEGGALLLLGGEGQALERVAERGLPPRRRGPARCDPATCPALLRGRPIFHAELRSAGPTGCAALPRDFATTVCLPMQAGGTPLGVATLGWASADPLPTRHLSFLHGVLQSGAVALHNARLALRRQTAMLRLVLPRSPAGAALDLAPEPSGWGRDAEAAGDPRAETPLLSIRCLGRFALERDGQEAPSEAFGRRQPLTLLKLLLTYYGRPLSWDRLAELLWPGEGPPNGRELVKVIVHRLRRALEPQTPAGQPSRFVRRSGDSYFFDPASPHRLDSREFLEAAARGARLEAEGRPGEARQVYLSAGALYGGDFLEDEPYAEWCVAERERLRERFLAVVRRLVQLYQEAGDADSAIAWCRRALAVDETLEEFHRVLMEALGRAGRREDALRQYQACRAVLARELDVAPSAETTALYQRQFGLEI